jgi:hypothetical protein
MNGAFSSKTTERYLHIKQETLINIPNILDELNKNTYIGMVIRFTLLNNIQNETSGI